MRHLLYATGTNVIHRWHLSFLELSSYTSRDLGQFCDLETNATQILFPKFKLL